MGIGNLRFSSSIPGLHSKPGSRLATLGVYWNPVRSEFSTFSGRSRKDTEEVLNAIRKGVKRPPRKEFFFCGA